MILWLAGCAYKVAVVSTPSTAVVELPDGTQTTTPAQVTLRWAPFNSQIIKVSARGFRPLEVDLRRSEVKAGRFLLRGVRSPRGQIELVMIPEHGPAGTRDAD